MPQRDESGQATIEHLGLVLLVALVLLAAGAIATVAAPGIGNRVTTAFQRGLCVVTGEECPTLDRQSCPVLRTDRTLDSRLTVGWLRLGDDRALRIERRSDGSYVIALVEGVGAGAQAGESRGPADAGADGMLSGHAGRTYRVADPAAARALVARLRRRALPAADALVSGAADLAGLAAAEPEVESYVLAGRGAATASVNLGLGPLLELGAEGEAKVDVGLAVAAHRREATAYVSVDGRVGAFFDALPAVSLPHGRRPGRHQGDHEGRDDRDGGAPRERDAGHEAGSTSLLNPDAWHGDREVATGGTIALRLAPGPRVLEVDITAFTEVAGERRELHARIDPRSPGVAEALAAWRRAPADPAMLAALGRAASAGAALDERRYTVDDSEREHGAEVSLGLGLELGATATQGLTTQRLVEQRSRPVGGLWETRLECAAA